MSVFDEDLFTPDELLFTISFDVARLPLGERVLMYFKSEPQVRSEHQGGL